VHIQLEPHFWIEDSDPSTIKSIMGRGELWYCLNNIGCRGSIRHINFKILRYVNTWYRVFVYVLVKIRFELYIVVPLFWIILVEFKWN